MKNMSREKKKNPNKKVNHNHFYQSINIGENKLQLELDKILQKEFLNVYLPVKPKE
jgi:hypothetical protein